MGETFKTDPRSMVQLIFLDQSMLYIKANSTVVVEEFRFNEKQKKDAMVTRFAKGSVRALTGLIGKRNPENVRFKSPAGTIGIRGTALEWEDDTVTVDFGSVVMTNKAGKIVILAGQRVLSGGLNKRLVTTSFKRSKTDSKNVAACMVQATASCHGLYKNMKLEEILFMTAMESQVPGFTPKNLTDTLQEIAKNIPVADSAILLTTSSQVYPESAANILKAAVKSKIDVSIAMEAVVRGLDKPSPEILKEVITTAINLGLTKEDAKKMLDGVKDQGICK
ncbi:MAG: FecR domain-containing protein [Gammaproteobacteria bacterium]|nr:FecR domain-containing protein [Gammaproteobacteria bacterium]